MVSRSQIYDLANKMRGRYGFARHRTRFLIDVKKAKRSGSISGSEFKDLMVFYRDVGKSKSQTSLLRLEQQVEKGQVNLGTQQIEEAKESTFKDYKSPVLQQKRAQETQLEASKTLTARQPEQESIMSRPESSKAELIAKNLALKGALPISMLGKPVDQELRVEVRQAPDRPPKPKTLLGKIWGGISSPVDVKKIPVLKKVPKVLTPDFAVETTIEAQQELLKKLGKVGNVLGDFGGEIAKEGYKSVKTPLTWITALGFGALGKTTTGAKVLSSKIVKAGTIGVVGGFTALDVALSENKAKALGGNIGRLGGFALVSFGVQAGLSLPKEYQYHKSLINADKLFTQAMKGDPNTQFVLKEKISGSQRDLTGKSLTDAKVKKALAELNKNKVFANIEKNTLKPYKNNILSTGQTKIGQNRIIAFDKLGRARAVKVIDHKPFVYDPKLQKYTEFVPGKYDLFTVPSNFAGKIRFEQNKIARLFTTAPQITEKATQKVLVKPKATAKSMKVFPPQKKFTPPKGKTVKIFSKKTGVTALDKAKLQDVFVQSQYTHPNYYVDTPKPPITTLKGITKDDSASLFFLPGKKPKPATPSGQNIDIFSAFKPTVKPTAKPMPDINVNNIPKPDSIFDVDISPDVIQSPKPLPDVIIAQAQKPKIDQIPVTDPAVVVLPVVTPAPTVHIPTSLVFDIPFPPTPTLTQKPPKPPINPFPDIHLYRKPKALKSFGIFTKTKKRGVKRMPTLKSLLFQERGKTQERSYKTGLGERFLPEIKFKKKKKKKR